MPRYGYRAKDGALNLIEGTIDAESEVSALNQLGRQGMFALSITPLTGLETSRTSTNGHKAPRDSTFRRRVATRTLAQTTRQLADLLGGGLPLLNALTLLSQQMGHPTLRRIIASLAISVRDGRSLSEALAEHPACFPSMYGSLVKAGEVSGTLEQALSRLADWGEQEAELKSRFLGASAYPLFVVVTAAAMTTFLMAYVIPTLSQVFLESGQALPLPTRILLAASGFVTRWWWALGVGLVGLGWSVRRWQQQPAGKAVVDRLLLVAPGVGSLTRKVETARYVRSLGVMVGQGVPVLQALEVAAQHVANTVVRQAARRIRAAVQDGASLSAALAGCGQFPAYVSYMVAVGEGSGTLDAALLNVASTYERELDRTLRTLAAVLEPVLLLVVGGIVMGVVLAMLLPVFQMGVVVQ